jgi:hypothetical protein
VWGVLGVWGTFDIPQTALVATLDTYDFLFYFGQKCLFLDVLNPKGPPNTTKTHILYIS